MVKTKVGYSELEDAYASGEATAKMAGVVENPQVGLFFTSCVQDQAELMKGAKSVLGDTPIIGCTSSAAVCTQDGYLNKETGYSAMMVFGGDLEVVTAGAAQGSESPRELARKVASEAISKVKGDKKPDYFFMSASPANEEEYIAGVQDVIGCVPVFGGSAADNTVEGKWSILNDGDAFADGLTIAIFYSDGEMTNLYTGEYNETKNVGVITEVRDERTLVSIDGEPALKKYAEWTGQDVESLKGGNLLTATITAPLGVKDNIGRVTAIRHPMNGNDDYSMNIGANLEVGTAIIQMKGAPEVILNANAKCVSKVNDLAKNDISSYFLVHCGGRRLGLQIAGIEDKIYPEIKKAIPNQEFLMVFTFGEYGVSDHSGNTVGGLSLSFTGFGE